MKICLVSLKAFLLAIVFINYSTAFYTAKIRFLQFRNPTGRVDSGGYCEGTSAGTCDNYFQLCVVASPSVPPTRIANCKYIKTSDSTRVESDNVDFQTSNTGIDKTITIHGFSWRGSIGFYMEIWDHDHLSSNDLIDRHNYRKVLTPGVNGTSQVIYDSTNGWRRSYKTTLTFTIQVYCNKDFYGSSCIKYCLPQNDAKGHYRCNTNGDHVCLQNWYQLPSCLTYCSPKDDAINGHYTCDNNGSHICRKDWYGLPNCLKSCIPRDDDVHGHYTCDSAGSRVCRPNWYNLPNCTKYCRRQSDPVLGYYSCDKTGNKICDNGWYGDNCTVYCVPRQDNLGHYNCTKKGEKLCHVTWYGTDCSKHCKARDDKSGRYNCSDNGNKICYDDYYGMNCSTLCKNESKRFFCEKNTGRKICLENWTGQFCNISKSISSMIHLSTSFIEFTSDVKQISSTRSERLQSSIVELNASAALYSAVSRTDISQSQLTRSTMTSSNIATTTLSELVKTSSLSINTAIVVIRSTLKYSVSSSPSSLSNSSPTSSIKPSTRVSSSSFEALRTTSLKKSGLTSIQITTDSSYYRASTVSNKKRSVFTSIKASKSGVVKETKTKSGGKTIPTIQASKKDTNTPGGISWLFHTKDGNVVLGGSGVGLVLILALIVAIAIYLRSPKHEKIDKKGFRKSLDSCEEDSDDLMKNARDNPLYIAMEDAKALGMQPRAHYDKKDKVFYEKKKKDIETKDQTFISDYEEEGLGVIQNPLYGVGLNFAYDDADETGV